jgi:hypothetical protein
VRPKQARFRLVLESAEAFDKAGGIERRDIVQMIYDELSRAYEKHGAPKWGRHEFFAVLKEEVDELWDAIKRDLPTIELLPEAIQIAAMVIRWLETGDRYRVNPNERGGADFVGVLA